MVRKARLLALLVASVCLLAKQAGGQPIGGIDYPADGQMVSGIVRVSGFALDFNVVDRIELLVDGVAVNRADMSLPRPDVLEIFPTYVNSATPNPGFLTSFLARGAYDDGPHSIAIRVTETATQQQFVVSTINVVVNSAANQAPFGFIDIPGPSGLQGANGSFPVVGWALDDVDVDRIDFLVDGQIVAGAVGRGEPSTAVYGSQRPDVQAAFPDVPNSLYSGFLANIDTTAFINGLHIISVNATDSEGASRELGHRTVQVVNNGANLPPFGQIDFPLDKASLFCSGATGGFPSPCTPEICSPSLFNVVIGWALDVGSALDRGQVSYLELLLDGQIIANTRSDCIQVNGALTNCYGINRPDVARLYSGYVNADNAGFNFSFFLGRNESNGQIQILSPRTASGQPELVGFTAGGKHTLAIRAGDEEETVTQFGAMSVDILCELQGGDQPAFGYIDQPSNNEFINGLFEVVGWATDFQGVSRVEVDVDGQVVGIASYGLIRPDVPRNDFRVTSSAVGFGFPLDTTALSNSAHDLVIYVVDRAGNRTEIGRRKFVVDNQVVVTHN
jgi:hypothetical protein